MAQKLRDDKIGTLSHSAGNIQMLASLSNPAYLTIGGQQYKITSTLVVALPAMSANTRYQVFAVQTGGVVSLVISQNENSVGPAGYTRWKLVGSLIASGGNGFNGNTVEFGSFITIEGVPKTLNKYNAGRITPTAHTVNPTKGNGGVGNTDRILAEIDGKTVRLYYEYSHSVSGTVGNGNYFLAVPFTIDTNAHQSNSDSFSGLNGQWNAYSNIGRGHISSGNSMATGNCQPYDSSRFRTWVHSTTTASAVNTGGWGSNYYRFDEIDLEFSWTLEYQSSVLSSTPIKDR